LDSSNHVTIRPPRRLQPHRAARPATSWSPRPPSASRPVGRAQNTSVSKQFFATTARRRKESYPGSVRAEQFHQRQGGLRATSQRQIPAHSVPLAAQLGGRPPPFECLTWGVQRTGKLSPRSAPELRSWTGERAVHHKRPGQAGWIRLPGDTGKRRRQPDVRPSAAGKALEAPVRS
jgi:hypothetical protein